MPRAKNNVAAKRRHKKVLKKARGYYGGRSRLYRTALESVHKGAMWKQQSKPKMPHLESTMLGLVQQHHSMN